MMLLMQVLPLQLQYSKEIKLIKLWRILAEVSIVLCEFAFRLSSEKGVEKALKSQFVAVFYLHQLQSLNFWIN